MSATEIEPGLLYLGNATDGMRAHEHPANFDRVITLGSMDSENTTDHFRLPDGALDSHTAGGWNPPIHERMFREAVRRVQGALMDGETVLVHCTAGQSRSVAVVIAVLGILDEISYDEAYNAVYEKRQNIHPAPALERCAKACLD